jgi:hypothetical protein
MLTEDEKVRIRHHLGYLNVQEAQTFVLGIPAAVQTQFMIEGAFAKVLPQAENLLRTLLCRCDEIEKQVFGGSDLADVTKTGNIEVNPKRLADLARYYRIAQQGMTNLLGVTANPFDMREWVMSGVGINVPVR